MTKTNTEAYMTTILDDDNPDWTKARIAKAVPFSGLPQNIQAILRGIQSQHRLQTTSKKGPGRRNGIERLLIWCISLSIGLATCCFGADRSVTTDLVDQAVISALPHHGNSKLKVISHIDLSKSFGTATQWTFVAVQEGGPTPTEMEEHGPIHLCFVKATHPDCVNDFYPQDNSKGLAADVPYHLVDDKVLSTNRSGLNRLFFVQVCTAQIFDGNCGVATALYQYDKQSDRFVRAFLNHTGRNNNEATRFVSEGPLQGDVIVNYPTENAPYTYWLEVYRADESGNYARILRYRGRTHYGDGNELAVADSEMPEILHRLGLWRVGDALPVPPHLPTSCSHLYMRQGEEWCK
ncbi:MAG TPA: hypothetical protein VGU23_07415 [Acidobacteriaceae bacterium]|nr:hypothetical protein [Acidobacteriaceae bacterium]